jgi:TolB-like protein/Flp pilus assembly protein TadD
VKIFEELKRRNVIRVGVAYLIGSWILLQVVDVLVPILTLPDWVGRLAFLFLVIGIVPVLIFSWAYELTPEGIRLDAQVESNKAISNHTARKLDRLTIALLFVVAGIVVVDRLVPETTSAPPVAVEEALLDPATSAAHVQDDRPSVAVMPFVNMSDDASNEYFSDGISEELLNALVGIRNLRVPSRTSSFTFKGSDKRLDEIGRSLNVEHILEGSVRKAGNQIRVTAQLVEARTDTRIWSETYTRTLDDIFAVQDEIAQSIVGALQLTLSGVDLDSLGNHSTDNVEAYDQYLVGGYYWNQRTKDSIKTAITHLKEAIELDPQFDLAWAALADAYVQMPEYEVASRSEYVPLARDAIKRALELNPNSARALATSGYFKAFSEYDWPGALEDLERAIEIEPGYATGRHYYGDVLNTLGDLDGGLEQLRLAREADPLSVAIRHVPGYMLLWNLRFEEAEAHYRDAMALGSPIRWTFQNQDVLNTLRGDYDSARSFARQLGEFDGFDPAADLARIDAVENPALKPRALELLEARTDMIDGVFGKGMQYMLLEEHDSALDSLENGLAIGDPLATHMNYVKVYDPIRNNPRFQAMLRKMNLLDVTNTR